MPDSTTWVGTDLELLEFLNAIGRHCECPDPIDQSCGAHALLRAEQATINRLIFARRIAEQLRREEWSVATPAEPRQ